MGVDLYAINPSPELPRDAQWGNPMMAWRLWYAFASLLEEVGADTSQLTYDNTGEVSEEHTTQWAALLRPIAGRTRRYVRGSISWFEILPEEDGSDPVAADGGPILARQAVFAMAEDDPSLVQPLLNRTLDEMQDPDATQEWLTFVADYLQYSGGCRIR